MHTWDLTHAHWFTSSHSDGNTNCVEVAFADPSWRKSSYSDANTDCVEVAGAGGHVGVRDSKHRAAGHLVFPAAAWATLLHALR